MLSTFWDQCSLMFPSFWHHLFEHRFHIDFVSIWRLIWVTISICFWYLFRSRTQTATPYKTSVFLMNLHVFTRQQNMEFHSFHDLFRYLFSIGFRWFCASISASFCNSFLCCFYIFSWSSFWCLWGWCFLDFTWSQIRKWMPKRPPQV